MQTLTKPFRKIRDRLSGKRRLTDRYLAEPKPHDPLLQERFAGRDSLTIFDVGACECLDSIRYQRMFSRARVHAFEADPRNVLRAEETLKRHAADAVILNPVAVAATEGELNFYASCGAPPGKQNDRHWDYGNKSGSLLEPDMSQIRSAWSWLRFDSGRPVPCTTIAAYCERHGIERIDLLHLDVQGAELMVLQGAGDALNRIDCIWLEVSSVRFHREQAVADAIHDFLQTHSFTRRLQIGDEPQWDELWCRS